MLIKKKHNQLLPLDDYIKKSIFLFAILRFISIEIGVIETTMYRAAGTISTTAIELLLVKLMLIRTTPLGQISTIALSRILRILI
jgi:hypothetical protein